MQLDSSKLLFMYRYTSRYPHAACLSAYALYKEIQKLQQGLIMKLVCDALFILGLTGCASSKQQHVTSSDTHTVKAGTVRTNRNLYSSAINSQKALSFILLIFLSPSTKRLKCFSSPRIVFIRLSCSERLSWFNNAFIS